MDIERVYEQYFKDVFLYVRSLSADAGTAEEIAQETFMKALKSIDSFDGSRDIRAWLFTIARNTYYTFCRREHLYVEKGYSEEYASRAAAERETDVCADVIEQLADEERSFLIHRFLHDMKEPYKEVFSLRVFGELPFEKIGQLFGKSSGWARVCYYRSKKMIQEYMEAMKNEKDQL
ncbi:MAG TPA: RNA polymerase sigma factor [Candidatus Mediterraneibacter merdavium]|nr:RNA polymerase sigma factor [Candidatus Mediterraneibacter merdavium]